MAAAPPSQWTASAEGSYSPLGPRFLHRHRRSPRPSVMRFRLAADPAFVDRLAFELIAGVGTEAEAVRGVVDRGVHGEHPEDQRVPGAELRGAPLTAEGVHQLDGVIREPAGHVVAVDVHPAISLLHA